MLQHQGHHRHRIGQREKLEPFVRDPLARQGHEVVGTFGAGCKARRIHLAREARRKAEEAQDPQMILGDALQRFADEPHPPRFKVGKSAEIVLHLAGRRIEVERVDGEIAPRRILAPVVGEADGGMPPIGRQIGTQGGDFQRLAGAHRGDRPVGDTRRNGLDPRRPAAPHDFVGAEQGRDIDVGDGGAQQSVAHRAADQARLSGPKRLEHPGNPRPFGDRHQRVDVDHAPSRRLRLTSIAAVAPQIRRPFQSIS